MEIKELELIKFKKIITSKINLHSINVLIGGNNAGKSSVLQGIHFSVGVATTSKNLSRATFIQNDLSYCPASNFLDLRNTSPYKNQTDFGFLKVKTKNEEDVEEKNYEIKIYQGRNYGNVGCHRSGSPQLATIITNNEQPFSIYVPGLAGVPQNEEYRTESIVRKAIASGGANLYLRNVLYLIKKKNLLPELTQIMKNIFPKIKIYVNFNEKTDEYISVKISNELYGQTTPLELVGTGIHQALQIFSYVTLFKPKILLLDEPDAHLHPNNQNLLAAALVIISNTSSTKIIISTHSRNLVDALYDDANIIWLKDGKIQQQGVSMPKVPMLMDIGALNDFGKLKDGEIDWVILTEDSNHSEIKILLENAGFKENHILIYSYSGCSKIASAKYLADFIHGIAENTNVIIHRDRDLMTDLEVKVITESLKGKNVKVFITECSDIESYFTKPKHISEVTGLELADVKTMLKNIRVTNHNKLSTKFSKKREDSRDLYRVYSKEIAALKDAGDDVKRPTTEFLLGEEHPIISKNCLGKLYLKMIQRELQHTHKINMNLVTHTNYINDSTLCDIFKHNN